MIFDGHLQSWLTDPRNQNTNQSNVSDAYLKPELQTDVGLKYLNQSYVKFYNLNKRDTILTNNFIVPKKGNLSVKLKNFSPILDVPEFFSKFRKFPLQLKLIYSATVSKCTMFGLKRN